MGTATVTSGVANQTYRAEAFRLELGWVIGEKQPFATIRFKYFHSKEIEKPRTCWLSPLSLTELVAIVLMNGVNTGRKWSQVAWVVPLSWNVRGFGLKQCWLCKPWGSLLYWPGYTRQAPSTIMQPGGWFITVLSPPSVYILNQINLIHSLPPCPF